MAPRKVRALLLLLCGGASLVASDLHSPASVEGSDCHVEDGSDVASALQLTGGMTQPARADATQYDLFIVIPARASEKARRDAQRKSWFRYTSSSRCAECAKHPTKVMFCVGNEGSVAESRSEAAAFGDMFVLEDFESDTYGALSTKVLACIRYAVRHYSFRFIMKTDTDSWVFLDRLLGAFDSRGLWGKRKLYAGDFRERSHVWTGNKTKWYDPIYPAVSGLQDYPKHAKGAGYILGIDLASFLSRQPEDTFEKFPCEDTGMGAWLMPVRKEVLDIAVFIEPTCKDGTLVDHYIFGEMMAKRWARYASTGDPCR